jgi:hypothetical protein
MRKCFGFCVPARDKETIGGTGEFRKDKKHGPPEWNHRGPVLKATRTAALSPEIKEGLTHHHNPTSLFNAYFFFFLAFFLAFFLVAIGTSF